jgi:protein ImuA
MGAGGGVRAETIEELRRRIRRLEGIAGEGGRVLPLGPALDRALPEGGLPLGCLHEVGPGECMPGGAADPWGGAATGFAAALAGRIAAVHGPVVWLLRATRRGRAVTPATEPYAPGLAAWGLGPERLVVARARSDEELLWALEEGLRCRGLGAVLAEVGDLDLTAGRRLQLAAEAGGVTALLLRLGPPRASASAAVTRWAVASAPSRGDAGRPGVGIAAWRLSLLRCRGGRPGSWLAEWRGDGFSALPVSGGEDAAGQAAGRQERPSRRAQA